MLKKFFNNKPGKNVKTRKLTFIITVTTGLLVIVFGACMIVLDKFDSATGFSETLDFLKWIITTGVVIVTVDKVKDVVNIYHSTEYEDDEDN